MSTIAKIFVVLVFALSIAFVVSSALLMTEKETWRDRYAQLDRDTKQKIEAKDAEIQKKDRDLAEAKTTISKTTDELERLKQEKAELERTKAQLQSDVTAKEKQVNELTATLADIRRGIGDWAARNEKLQKDVADLQAKLKEAEDALRQAKAEREKAILERDEMTKKASELEGVKKDLEDRLARASEALEKLQASGDIRVQEVLTGAQKPVDGRVLEVDPVNNVVIINVGKAHGVGLGYAFTVYRDNQYVGEIRVDQLKDDLAGATPIPGTLKSEIRKGDNVTTRIR